LFIYNLKRILKSMSHAIYQTPAIILKTKNMRESNKLVVLYTERFGLIYTTMQSIRELKSKMKYHTNTLSLVTVDVVRGRDIWRITGIHEDISSLSFVENEFYTFIHRIAVLLLRMSQGEESHREIWNDLHSLYKNIDTIDSQNYEAVEIITIARMLYFLGYWDGTQSCITSHTIFNNELFDEVIKNKLEYIKLINQGIIDSQL